MRTLANGIKGAVVTRTDCPWEGSVDVESYSGIATDVAVESYSLERVEGGYLHEFWDDELGGFTAIIPVVLKKGECYWLRFRKSGYNGKPVAHIREIRAYH